MSKILKFLKSKIPKKTNTINELRIRNPKGFTLVEILVAVIILSIGILAVSQMTVIGMRTTTVVNQRMYARTTMAQVFEELNNLPFNDSLLTNDGDNGDLDVIDSTADYSQTFSDSILRTKYEARWNIADSVPELNIKTIRIHILWGFGPDTSKKRISTDLFKRMTL